MQERPGFAAKQQDSRQPTGRIRELVALPRLGDAAIRSKEKATSLVIAHLAGVSQPTVSRALRGSPMVNEVTRARILKIARELNYKVDKNASSLRSKYRGTLALLFFKDPAPDDSLINPFFVSMLASITHACAQRGYDLLLSFQHGADEDWQADFEDSHNSDGIILLGYGDYQDYRSRLEFLIARGIHFVRWGAVLPDQAEVSVSSDNFRGGYDITLHLLQQGAARIAFLGDASNHYPEFFERYRGHTAALRSAGLPVASSLQADAISSEQSGYDAAISLLDRGAQIDAICAASDLIAIGAMKALLARGLKVPDDVLVSGFDDIPLSSFVNPSLTTVQQDTKIAGGILVDALVKLIHDEPVENQVIPVNLILRDSTKRG